MSTIETTCIYGYRLDEPCRGKTCTADHQPPLLTEAEAQLVIGAIPLQALPEQPAPEADEWHVERDPIHGCSVITKGRIVAASIYRPEDADQIVTDHARAALVPGLVEALKLCMLDTDLAAMSGNPIANERHKIADAALAAARKAGVE